MPVKARLAAPLAAALALAACGGKPEKAALRTYEAAVEGLMEEDGRVSAQLTDLYKDMATANAGAKEQSAYGRDQALPFYTRFREAAARAPAEQPKLRAVHAGLLEYLDERLAYLRGFEALIEASGSESLERLRRLEAPWQAAQEDLAKGIQEDGGKLDDPDATAVLQDRMKFMSRVYEPFQRGQVAGDDVEKALRIVLIPRLSRIAERTKEQRAVQGPAGVLARWAAAELAFFQEMASSIPQQQALQKARDEVQDHWKKSGELRDAYLAALRSYRDSLR
jgi:hypothetical protein